MTTVDDRVQADEPITEDWLRAAGFKWHQFERQPSKQWLLWLGGVIGYDEARGGRRLFSDTEDLGIELAPCGFLNSSGGIAGHQGQWFCWLRSDTAGRYHRFVHVRHLSFTIDLVLLIEGLTGQHWDVANNMHGCMLRPEHAAYRREEAERLDRKLMQERRHWYPAEEDDSRGRALPEHLNAAIESGKAK